ncbi:hypothetical protein [Shrimp hemocyte iridescent virus]|uniref:Uncharacterized protein n=1 Tax=Shrimp hemocyte iridescent virus TaxID=2039780 RepID=A0A291B0W1_9VIRU|nr:hypothetical protein KM509_gp126 [Shrimp hemocyte iridescent virus]ATE87135.1 hypothetical protein [Shrimp hemocyte iridescent virus]
MVKENFCGLCMAVPIALAGAGVAGGLSAKEYKKRKMIALTVGIVVLLISLGLYWYYKDCQTCKL